MPDSIKFRTKGGSTVEVTAQLVHDEVTVVGRCHGCYEQEQHKRSGVYPDPNEHVLAHRSTYRVREWAKRHADSCAALGG